MLFFFLVLPKLGPDDHNGYGYFHVRLCWTEVDFQASAIEEYMVLCALSHICACAEGGASFKGVWSLFLCQRWIWYRFHSELTVGNISSSSGALSHNKRSTALVM